MSFIHHKRTLKTELESPKNEIHKYKCNRRTWLCYVLACDELTVWRDDHVTSWLVAGEWGHKFKGSDAPESFLSKVAFESDFWKKYCTCVVKTFSIFLLSKETFRIRTCSILESYFRKLLSKATFERKLSSVSIKRLLTYLLTYYLNSYIFSRLPHLLSSESWLWYNVVQCMAIGEGYKSFYTPLDTTPVHEMTSLTTK